MTRATILALIALIAPQAALAQSCPEQLASARRLVLVAADTMSSTSASVQRFTRTAPNATWQQDGGPATALIGYNGIGWAHAFRSFARAGEPVKVDGDKRVPAGFYKIGRSFGFSASRRPGYLRIADGMVCDNDAASPAYNTYRFTRQGRLESARRKHVARAGIPARALGRLPDRRQVACRFLHFHPYPPAGGERNRRLRLAAEVAGRSLAEFRTNRRRAGCRAAAGARSLQRLPAGTRQPLIS